MSQRRDPAPSAQQAARRRAYIGGRSAASRNPARSRRARSLGWWLAFAAALAVLYAGYTARVPEAPPALGIDDEAPPLAQRPSASSAPPLYERRAAPTPVQRVERRAPTLADTAGGVRGVVIDAAGGPIVGAAVGARALGTEPSLVHAVSDDDGRFALETSDGEQELVVTADGYAPRTSRVRAPARAVTLVLMPEGGLMGQVVRADDGAPIADVLVSVATPRATLARTHSDSDGRFRVQGLPPGTYAVVARSRSWHAPPRQVVVDAGGVAGPLVLGAYPASAVLGSIELEGEACRGAHVTLLGASAPPREAFAPEGRFEIDGVPLGTYHARVTCPGARERSEVLLVGETPVELRWSLERGLVLRGRVEDPDGAGVPGAQVHLSPAAPDSGVVATSCNADEQGAFECGGLAAGSYWASAVLGDAPAGERSRVDVSERSGPFTLRTHGFGAIRVTVVGAGGAARPVAVFARGVTPEPVQAVRGEGGEHLLERLPLGTHEVYVEPGGAGEASAEATLEQHGERVTIVLQYPELFAIAGRVLDAGGAPVVDAHVRARPAPSDDAPPLFFTDVEAWSDPQGEFVLEGLARGAYELHVSSGAGNCVLRPVSAGAEAVTVVVQAPARLAGQVRAPDGALAASFSLAYERRGGDRLVTSGHAGHFELTELEPGAYEVTITAAGGEARGQVTLAPGAEQSLLFQLAPSLGDGPPLPHEALASPRADALTPPGASRRATARGRRRASWR